MLIIYLFLSKLNETIKNSKINEENILSSSNDVNKKYSNKSQVNI